jgi:hypothetical protein
MKIRRKRSESENRMTSDSDAIPDLPPINVRLREPKIKLGKGPTGWFAKEFYIPSPEQDQRERLEEPGAPTASGTGRSRASPPPPSSTGATTGDTVSPATPSVQESAATFAVPVTPSASEAEDRTTNRKRSKRSLRKDSSSSNPSISKRGKEGESDTSQNSARALSSDDTVMERARSTQSSDADAEFSSAADYNNPPSENTRFRKNRRPSTIVPRTVVKRTANRSKSSSDECPPKMQPAPENSGGQSATINQDSSAAPAGRSTTVYTGAKGKDVLGRAKNTVQRAVTVRTSTAAAAAKPVSQPQEQSAASLPAETSSPAQVIKSDRRSVMQQPANEQNETRMRLRKTRPKRVPRDTKKVARQGKTHKSALDETVWRSSSSEKDNSRSSSSSTMEGEINELRQMCPQTRPSRDENRYALYSQIQTIKAHLKSARRTVDVRTSSRTPRSKFRRYRSNRVG